MNSNTKRFLGKKRQSKECGPTRPVDRGGRHYSSPPREMTAPGVSKRKVDSGKERREAGRLRWGSGF